MKKLFFILLSAWMLLAASCKKDIPAEPAMSAADRVQDSCRVLTRTYFDASGVRTDSQVYSYDNQKRLLSITSFGTSGVGTVTCTYSYSGNTVTSTNVLNFQAPWEYVLNSDGSAASRTQTIWGEPLPESAVFTCYKTTYRYFYDNQGYLTSMAYTYLYEDGYMSRQLVDTNNYTYINGDLIGNTGKFMGGGSANTSHAEYTYTNFINHTFLFNPDEYADPGRSGKRSLHLPATITSQGNYLNPTFKKTYSYELDEHGLPVKIQYTFDNLQPDNAHTEMHQTIISTFACD